VVMAKGGYGEYGDGVGVCVGAVVITGGGYDGMMELVLVDCRYESARCDSGDARWCWS
jgi:hypothetical protein